MHVAAIWRFPVKSLGGERLDAGDVTTLGIDGDRAWGLRDLDTGLVLTARRVPELLFLHARHRAGLRPEIVDADGKVLDADALSARLGRTVALVAADDGPGTFEAPLDEEQETDWVRWDSAGSTFHDGRSTVSLVGSSELGDWDERRFRINLILDGADAPQDGTLRIGRATIRLRRPIDRCVMVTRAQPGLDADRSVLRTIAADRGNRLGVGGVVVEPGRIAVGDAVTVVDRP